MGNDDRGQLLPLVALLVAMALGLAVLIVETALLVGERAIAQTAADAAALAAVVDPGDGRGRAGEMAAANGAVLESFRQLGTSVEVTVRVGVRVRPPGPSSPPVGANAAAPTPTPRLPARGRRRD